MLAMISLIAVVARNGAIGNDQKLLWQLPEDLRHFRETTRGKPVIMGRKTWESLPPSLSPLAEAAQHRRQPQPGLPRERGDAGGLDRGGHSSCRRRQRGASSLVARSSIADAATCQAPVPDRSRRRPAGDAFFPEVTLAEWREVSRRAGNAPTLRRTFRPSTSWSTSVASRHSKQQLNRPAVPGRSADVARRLATRIRCRRCLRLKFPMSDLLQTYLEAPEGAGKVLAHARLLVKLAGSIRRSRRRIWPGKQRGQSTSRGIVVIHATSNARWRPSYARWRPRWSTNVLAAGTRVHRRAGQGACPAKPEPAARAHPEAVQRRTSQELTHLSESLPASPLRAALENLLARSARQE
jgi:dihydrofolate reductase